eukprot:TRINITY_DN2504_c0_g1_i3.p2 TRINITY_DN2504_c0_g1~~TRINITY_DN2504_c0_g1_i3.p2  ORF type:complete len:294 (-),score=41.45 TRINITY_DN2504_c0_g1_i3:864-1745(-)
MSWFKKVADFARGNKKLLAKALGLLVFLGICIAGFVVLSVLGYTSKFLDLVDDIGYWGYLLFIVAFIAMGMPFLFGYSVLGLAAGFLYYIYIGTALMYVGTNIGAWIAFFGCRYLFRKSLIEEIEKNAKINAVFMAINEHALKLSLLIRYVPGLPWGMQNAVMAVSVVPFWKFALGTAIAVLPEQVVITYFGSTIRSLSEIASGERGGTKEYILLAVEGAIAILFLVMVVIISRRALKKMTAEQALIVKEGEEDSDDNEKDVHDVESVSQTYREACDQELLVINDHKPHLYTT